MKRLISQSISQSINQSINQLLDDLKTYTDMYKLLGNPTRSRSHIFLSTTYLTLLLNSLITFIYTYFIKFYPSTHIIFRFIIWCKTNKRTGAPSLPGKPDLPASP